MSAEAARVARDAAQYLRDHGWCQRAYSDAQGRACLLGAVRQVGGSGVYGLWDALAARVGTSSFPQWNDLPGRTAGQVIALLERVADDLDPAVTR